LRLLCLLCVSPFFSFISYKNLKQFILLCTFNTAKHLNYYSRNLKLCLVTEHLTFLTSFIPLI
jgi:hypothetical protein